MKINKVIRIKGGETVTKFSVHFHLLPVVSH